jgi:GDP-L-fucose synthase
MRVIDLKSKIFVAGHRGLVGGALVRALTTKGAKNLVLKDRHQLDLRNPQAVEKFFAAEKPALVILAAAKVGGIVANEMYRGDFILENLEIQTNVIGAAFRHGVEKLVFLGSACIYPKVVPQPIAESALLAGPLEPTNSSYAVAKIAGLVLCQSLNQQYGRRFISVMPTNVYGPGDRYDAIGSHVLPALMLKLHNAKIENRRFVDAWGTGAPMREFIHCDDLASAIVHCLLHYEGDEHLNIGSGQELSIRELAEIIKEVVGFAGEIRWDETKPDGTLHRRLDCSRLRNLGWQPLVPLREGIAETYRDFLAHLPKVKSHFAELVTANI